MSTYSNHPLNNCVIKNESREMGKRIIEFWKKNRVNTGHYIGTSYPSNGGDCFYYGLINGEFNMYSITDVNYHSAKIIQLPPKETELVDLATLPSVEMMVSDDGKMWYKQLVIGKYNGLFITYDHDYKFAILWKFAKPIEPEPLPITMSEATRLLSEIKGCPVKIENETK